MYGEMFPPLLPLLWNHAVDVNEGCSWALTERPFSEPMRNGAAMLPAAIVPGMTHGFA